MRVSPSSERASGTEKEMPPTIRRLVENFALCRIGPRPIPPCSPSRLVALSRCPDATYILTAPALRENGTKVTRSNHRRTAERIQGRFPVPVHSSRLLRHHTRDNIRGTLCRACDRSEEH